MIENNSTNCSYLDPRYNKIWEKELQKAKDKIRNAKKEKAVDQRMVLKSLSHPIRLKILSELSDSPKCVCEIIDKLGLSNSKASYHLFHLMESILISYVTIGRNVVYFKTDYGDLVLNWLDKLPDP